jgi:hypothetical protein
MARNTLGLKIDGSLTFSSFNKASGLFWALIKALSTEIGEGAPITWRLADLSKGSATLTLAAETAHLEIAERIVHAYANVGTALSLHQPIPYSPKVNSSAQALSQLIDGDITALYFTTDLGSVSVTEPVGVGRHRKKTQAWGTVDGMLETITSHRRLAFTLYENHFGLGVTCIVRQDQEQDMLDHWRKFVRVSGLIIRDAHDGRPLEIHQISDVRELDVSAPDSYRQAAGILDLQGEAPEDLIRKLRDASA